MGSLTRRSFLQSSCAGFAGVASAVRSTRLTLPTSVESGLGAALEQANNAQPAANRITGLRAWQPKTPGAPTDWRTQLGQIIVEVQTESGVTGIGVGGGGAAGIHIIETVLRDLLMGRDASQVEALYRAMYESTVFYGRKGLVIMAISGVDLALWDARGKRADAPVAKLLNPQVDLARAIPTYTTIFHENELEAALAAGNSAIKVEMFDFEGRPDVGQVAELLRRVRARIGAKMPLMLDAFGRLDVETAVRMAKAVAPLDIRWLEEPVPPDDLAGYAEVVRRSPVPIAGGEHEYTEKGFRDFAATGVRVLQPDINWCGGLTPVVEVYRMAKQKGVRVVPHRGSEPFALHAIAALDPEPLAESGRPWWHLEGEPKIEHGVTRLHDAPGFGVRAKA